MPYTERDYRCPRQYKRPKLPSKTIRSNEEVKTLGIPRDWFPRDAQGFRGFIQRFFIVITAQKRLSLQFTTEPADAEAFRSRIADLRFRIHNKLKEQVCIPKICKRQTTIINIFAACIV